MDLPLGKIEWTQFTLAMVADCKYRLNEKGLTIEDLDKKIPILGPWEDQYTTLRETLTALCDLFLFQGINK